MSGRFNVNQFLIVAVFLVAALMLVFWLRQPSANSGQPQSSQSNANLASPGSPVPSLTPQGTGIPQETVTPQGTGTPMRTPQNVELSPAVVNGATADALGWNPTPNAIERTQMEEADLSESLFTRLGTVIAQGTNQTPTSHGLTTYRVEEVAMTGTVSLTWGMPSRFNRGWDVQRVTFDRFWRLTVSGPGIVPLPTTNSAESVIWINGNKVGGGKINGDTHEVSTVVFDRSLLTEGGRIAVSSVDSVEFSQEVPETIHYNSQP